jgi:hypothetical protein
LSDRALAPMEDRRDLRVIAVICTSGSVSLRAY